MKKWIIGIIIVLVLSSCVGTETTETNIEKLETEPHTTVVSETLGEEAYNETAAQTTVPVTQETREDIPATTEPLTVPTVSTTEIPEKDIGIDYVLNTNTRKFHFSGCSSAKRIKASNRVDFHGTREDVVARGYQACGKCNP